MKRKSFRERLKALPIELQLVFLEDLETSIETRLKTLEGTAKNHRGEFPSEIITT